MELTYTVSEELEENAEFCRPDKQPGDSCSRRSRRWSTDMDPNRHSLWKGGRHLLVNAPGHVYEYMVGMHD